MHKKLLEPGKRNEIVANPRNEKQYSRTRAKNRRSLFRGLLLSALMTLCSNMSFAQTNGLSFDGSDDYVSVASPFYAFTNAISVEWSANINFANMGSGIGQALSGVDNMSTNVWLMHCNGDGTISFLVNDNGVWRGLNGMTITPGWHHYAGVANTSGVFVYVDGVLTGSTSTGITTGIVNVPTSSISFGKDVRFFTDRYMNGSIDEVRIWNRALCQNEIQANRSCELSSMTGLVGYYKLNEGTAGGTNTAVTSTADASGGGHTGILHNFALSGSTSNWVTGHVSGSCSAPAITGPSAVCPGAHITLASPVCGTGWSSSATSIATVNSSGVVTGVSAGTATISYLISDTSSLTTVVTVHPLPPAITGVMSFCIGTTTSLSDSVTGGSWSSNDTSTITIDPATGIAFGVTGGTSQIAYTAPTGCSTTAVLTVAPLPVSIPGTPSLCQGANITLGASLPGGAWSSSDTSIATVNSSSGNVVGISAGTATISYQISGACGTSAASVMVVVNPTPTITLGTMPTVCAGTASASFPYSSVTGTPSYNIHWNDSAQIAGFTDAPALISTVAGIGEWGYSGDGGTATAAALEHPSDVAFDAFGNMYIADRNNNVVRKVNSSGVISTVAGHYGYGGSLGDGGPATAASLDHPRSLTLDASGNLYIADAGNGRIRKVTTSGTISTVAGGGTGGGEEGGGTGDGGPATAATFGSVRAIAMDASGNLYIVDDYSYVVRKVNPSGMISTIAGNGSSDYSGDGGAATSASLNYPTDVAADASGNVYIADQDNHVVRKVTPAGIISTFAGNNALGYSHSGDGGPATSAGLGYPVALATDVFGNVYISAGDEGLFVVRKVSSTGTISTYAGNYDYWGEEGGDGGPATAAHLNGVNGLGTDPSGNLYAVEQYNNTVRKVSNILPLPSGAATTSITTSAPAGTYHGTMYLYNGPCSNPYPVSVTVAPSAGPISGSTGICSGNTTSLTVPYSGGSWSSTNTAVATVGSTGLVSGVAAGTTTISYQLTSSCGTTTATAIVMVTQTPALTLNTMPSVCAGDTSASFTYSLVDGTPSYNIHWSDSARAAGFADAPALISTVAGDPSMAYEYSGDGGPATSAGLSAPSDVAFDALGNMYIADRYNNVVRKVSSSGVISTVAGQYSSETGGLGDGGPATAANLSNPRSLAFDVYGNLYIADIYNHVIRKVTPDGTISTFAGNGDWGYSGDGGPATAASFNYYLGNIAADGAGNLYIADGENNVVRKVDPSGIITTVAGNGGEGGYSGDGGAATSASLNFIEDVATDAAGNLYIADLYNHVVRKVTPAGIISTVAGDYTIGDTYSGDGGPATSAGLSYPGNLATDGFGNLYIGELGNAVVRKVSPTGTINTWAGTAGSSGYSGDGGPATAAQIDPGGFGIDAFGNLYFAEASNGVIRKVSNISPLPSASVSTHVPSTAPLGTYHGTMTVYNGMCTNSYPISVTIGVSITGTASVCQGAATSLSGTVSGGSWFSSNDSVATVSSGGVVSGISAGTAVISYVVSESCNAAITVTVTPLPSAGTITGPSSMCVGGTITLSDATSGGSWSSNAPGIASVNTSGVATGNTAGSALISYTVANTCGSASATKAIIVNPLPDAGTITGASSVNVGNTITLSDTVSGGTWSAGNSNATVSSAGVVTGMSNGSVTISYTVTNSCGTSVATKIVTVNGATVISGPAICMGATTTLSGTPAGGTWTSGNTPLAVVNASGVVTGVSAGTVNISYNAGGIITVTNVTVMTTAAVIAGTPNICNGGSTTLSTTPSGGTWSASDGSIAGISTTGLLSGLSIGTATISYTLSNGCARTTVATINAVPVAIGGLTTICVGGSTTLTNEVPGGVFSSSNSAVATATSAGVVNGVTAGSSLISYSIGGCRVTTTMSVVPAPAITGTFAACAGTTTLLSNSVTGGTWNSSAPLTADVTSGLVTGVNAGTAIISYTLPGGCIRTQTVTINAIPTINGPSVVCIGGSMNVTSTPASTTWSSSVPAKATINTSGLVTGVSAGSTTISVTTSVGCSNSAVISVNAQPTISGVFTTCLSGTTSLTGTPTGGTWTSSSTGIASVGSASGLVTGVTANNTATISYSLGAGCLRTAAVTVNALPAIAGTPSMCVGGTVALSGSPAGGSWSSIDPLTATVGSTGTVTGQASGTTNIVYTNATTGCSRSVVATVNATPGGFSGTTSVCVGATTTLTNAVSGGTWTSSSTTFATVGISTGIVTGVAAGSAVMTYRIGTCQATIPVTVKALPNAITGGMATTVGATITLSNTTTGGGTWSSSTPSAGTISSSGVVTGIGVGTSTIVYTGNVTGCTKSAVVTINAVPSLPGPRTVCVGSTINISSGSVSVSSWSSSDTSKATVSAGVITGIAPGTATITYNLTAGGYGTTDVTVTSMPAPITGTLSLCGGFTTTLSDITPGGTWSSANTGLATVGTNGVVTGVAGGSVAISYTLGTGCRRIVTVTVANTPGPITGTASVCKDIVMYPYLAVVGSGSWSSSDTTIATVPPTHGAVRGIAAGTATISFTNAFGCSSTRQVTVNLCPSRGMLPGTTGITNINDVNISLYPNPTKGTFSVNTPEAGSLSVSAIDGREVMKRDVKAGVTGLTLPSDITTGVYMCRFIGENGATLTVRLVFEND